MSNTQAFSPLTASTWSCWGDNLVSFLTSKDCDQISFNGGGESSGTLSFHHTVPLSDGKFAFTFTYDSGSQTLTVVITDSPDDISNSTIFDAINSYIYTCPPASS